MANTQTIFDEIDSLSTALKLQFSRMIEAEPVKTEMMIRAANYIHAGLENELYKSNWK